MNVAIIPARSGSKRIKNKNIKLFFGKPIITYVIKLLIKSKIFDKIIVSTDSDKIAKICAKSGAEILFKRPKSLAGDYISTKDVVKHAIMWMSKNLSKPSRVCCIYPTAVLLTLSDLKKSFIKFKSNKYDYLFSATKYPHPIQRSFYIDRDKIKMDNKKNFYKRTQGLKDYYYDIGQFYWGKSNAWLNDKIIFDKNSAIQIIPKHRAQDIDDLQDWKFVEKLFLINKETINK